ncbi:MAG: hypothetical protein ACJA1N_001381 [Saprospiraceae bacterium]|jgi:hypothetical protein
MNAVKYTKIIKRFIIDNSIFCIYSFRSQNIHIYIGNIYIYNRQRIKAV